MNAPLLVGRDDEKAILHDSLSSNQAAFIAVYGRRRVGKTFLIEQYFSSQDVTFFKVTGIRDGTLSEQVKHFTTEIGRIFYAGASLTPSSSWDDTFAKLTDALKFAGKDKKIVLFFDEFPWMDTQHSRLIQQLEYYWNQHWSTDPRVKLIICGSAASWIINQIINNTGGLHNRITHLIHLEPYTLSETKQYLKKHGIKLNHAEILKLYMCMGGIPYYLSKIQKGKSATQIIEALAFRKKSFFLNEFNKLFAGLFKHHEIYIELTREIAKHRYGVNQTDLLNTFSNEWKAEKGIKLLQALEDAGFIMRFIPHFHKKKGIYYRVIDEYTLFYFHWIEPVKQTLLSKGFRAGYWMTKQTTPSYTSWSGYAFESICYHHLSQISVALDMSPTAIPNSWRYTPQKNSKEKGAQIDLLFDRDDNAINVCEIKYTDKPYVITKDFIERMRHRIKMFQAQTRTKKQMFVSLISAAGVKKNFYYDDFIDSHASLDDLFED